MQPVISYKSVRALNEFDISTRRRDKIRDLNSSDFWRIKPIVNTCIQSPKHWFSRWLPAIITMITSNHVEGKCFNTKLSNSINAFIWKLSSVFCDRFAGVVLLNFSAYWYCWKLHLCQVIEKFSHSKVEGKFPTWL